MIVSKPRAEPRSGRIALVTWSAGVTPHERNVDHELDATAQEREDEDLAVAHRLFYEPAKTTRPSRCRKPPMPPSSRPKAVDATNA